MRYDMMNRETLMENFEQVTAQYRTHAAAGLALDMSRGKPHADQLAFTDGILEALAPGDYYAEDGTDCRNYGGLDGLPEMKRLFAEILDVSPTEIIVGGNASLNMMFDCIAAFCHQHAGWRQHFVENISERDSVPTPVPAPFPAPVFLTPAPGYDRHFAICEYFGLLMRPIPMTPDGPDMNIVEEQVKDPAVVGMWCVPVFSNPQGVVYSADTIRRLAAMQTANDGFRLFWDNAYTVHHFRGARPQPLNILRLCEQAGCADRPLVFTSFSKISYAGAGVAAMAASAQNRALYRRRLSIQTVGPDKMNQLRHVRYFKNIAGVLAHMDKLAAILRPKFELADRLLNRHLAGTGAASWCCPNGGYFLSLDVMPGCARRVAALCRDAGVILTPAGATWPYGKDPLDSNLRLAPSYVAMTELETALEVLCTAIKLAALEQCLSKGDV